MTPQPSRKTGRLPCAVAAAAVTALVGVATAGAATAATPPVAQTDTPAPGAGTPVAGAEAPATGPEAPAEPATAAEARARLDELTAQIAATETRQGEAEARAAQLAQEIEATQLRLADLRARLGHRARAVYTEGVGSEPLLALLTSDRPTAAVDRMSMLDAAQGHDSEVLERTVAVERRLAAQRQQAEGAVTEAATAKAELTRSVAEIDAVLQHLVAEEEAARAREAALAAAGLPLDAAATGVTVVDGGACPVGPVHSFIDSWGFPRSGGRAHQGTDVMAPHGAPAFAVVDGVIDRVGNNGLGGLVVYLRGHNGHRYYYAHNAANLVTEGQQVVAGQEIAKVGNTGNAAGGAAHIHFEVHPGGGAAANPYAFLKSVCG